MRTIVEIPDEQIAALDRMRASEKISRAEIIRRAVEAFLRRQRERDLEELAGFGCWAGMGPDGVEHQRRLRSEWER